MVPIIRHKRDRSFAERSDSAVSGFWLLARLGKRVLRPGGVALTSALVSAAAVEGADVVELAPGIGRTAAEIIARGPRAYVGVEQNPAAAQIVREIVGKKGDVRIADAAHTGLPSASADVVVGEAMLTMQGDKGKGVIIDEAVRLLRADGRYAIHELSLIPDSVAEEVKTTIRRRLAAATKVNARPLTIGEWTDLLTAHGLRVTHVRTGQMALLQPRRLVADEGVLGALRFVANVLMRRDARKRVFEMRRTFREYRNHLAAVAIVADRVEKD